MNFKISYLRKIIKEEINNVLADEAKINEPVLKKALSQPRMGRYKKCDQAGLVGLRRNCMGRSVADLQAAINQYFLEKERTAKMISIDGVFGRQTAEALGYINSVVDPEGRGPRLVNLVTPKIDRELAKINKAGQAITSVDRAIRNMDRMMASPSKNSPEDRASRVGKELLGVDLSKPEKYMPSGD